LAVGRTIAAASRAARVERLLARLEKSARRTRRRSDSEAIHDTRLATRRLAAGLDIWRDAMPPAARRRAQRALRRLRRSLGPAREAEVSAALLDARLTALAVEAPTVVPVLLLRLERRATRARRQAAGLCGRDSVRRVVGRVARAWKPLGASDPVRLSDIAAARARLSRRASVARSKLHRGIGSGEPIALHGARIALKHWRYGLEWMDGLEAGAATADPDGLRAVQGSLGTLNDLAILQATLHEITRGARAASPRGVAAVQRLIARLDVERREELARLGAFVDSEMADQLDRPRRFQA
jgi:CHAD domain-containing protein